MRIFVTGGAGFIGSALVRHLIRETEHEVLVYDALTYAGTLTALAPVANDPRYRFVRGDIRDGAAVRGRLRERAKSYALMTAIRDTARVYPFAGRKTSVRIDLGGCAADA